MPLRFLSNVSSMTKDISYESLSTGGSHLDGDERIKLLRDYKVMFGDVLPQREVSYLAMASCERLAGGGVVSEARRTRLSD